MYNPPTPSFYQTLALDDEVSLEEWVGEDQEPRPATGIFKGLLPGSGEVIIQVLDSTFYFSESTGLSRLGRWRIVPPNHTKEPTP